MHENPIVFRNGLVNPTVLLEYMDSCHCSDLPAATTRGGHRPEYHHAYFPLPHFKNNWVPLSIRRLRNSKYNQIKMLSCQEDLYHQKTASFVSRDQIDLDSADMYLEEGEQLNAYAASGWLIANIQSSLESYVLLTKGSRARLAAKLAILTEMNHDQASRVNSIKFIAPEIVSGALASYIAQQPEAGMESLLEERLLGDKTIIFTKIHSPEALRHIARMGLAAAIERQSWPIRSMLTASAEAA